jgi:lipopolysaccharide/colanic/teichoic acid biosynthesis glycosyltransferase
MAKRLFDIAFSALALTALAPLLLAIALWVKLDSPGPALFRQVRVGRRGREFRIFKFRTMHVDAERTGPHITVGADARITRSGAFLRKYKLDELPQFINVLFGDMSVVGPRPEVPRYVALYPEELRELVLSVRPGITDRASIEFRDENALLGASVNPEAAYVEQVMPIKLGYYAEYAADRSFAGDLMLIWRTAVLLLPFRAASDGSRGPDAGRAEKAH